MALIVGGQFLYFMLFLALLVLGYSYLSVRSVGKNLVGLFWLSKFKVVRDDTVNIDVKLYDSSLFPISYIEVDYNISKKLTRNKISEDILNIKPFESIKLYKEVICNRRGVYNLGNIKVKIVDVFGLVNKTVSINDSVTLTVYPKIYELSSFKITEKESYGNIKSNTGYEEDYSSIKDIRKYKFGDSPKRINWKVSAKRGKLYIRNYEIYNNLKVKIYLDFDKDKYMYDKDGDIEEKIVECAISIINYLLKRNIQVELITYTDSRINMYGKNTNSLADFLELVTTIRPVNNTCLKDVIDIEKNFLLLSDTIIMITPIVDEQIVSSVVSLKKRNHSISLINVYDFMKIDPRYINNIETLEKLGIQTFKLGISDEIDRVLR